MDEPPLENKTEFAAHPQLLLDRDGEKLVTVVKASFELEPDGEALELAPAERTRGIRMSDIPWGEPDVSSIAYPAELCLRKPGTDVIVVAEAHSPGGEPSESFDVRVEVGPLKKSLTVFGPRVWQARGSGLSAPAPMTQLEMRYEYAWGGFDDSDPERIVEEPRNPIGRGKVADPAALTNQPAPCIEDPAALISSYRSEPPPAGLGAIGRHWMPRRKYAGTYDEQWQESRAPLPPLDFDDRFNLCASPGLVAASPLLGGERVALLNLLPGGGATTFSLPRIEVTVEFRVAGLEPAVLRPPHDTVLIDLLATGPDKPPAVELSWRAYVKAPRRMNDARIIVTERDRP